MAGNIKLEEIIRLSLMPKDPPAILKSVSVNLPFGMGGATWEADPTEQNAAWELYDLVADPGETKNLYRQHPDIVKRLTRLLDQIKQQGRSY